MRVEAKSKKPGGCFTLPGERNHCLLLCGLGFWAGCRLAPFFRAAYWLWALAAVVLLIWAVLRRLGLRGGAALFFCALCLGALRTLPEWWPKQPDPGVYEEISGYVYGEARLRADSRMTFTLGKITLDGNAVEGRAYCTLYFGKEEPPYLFDGAALTFSGRVYHPEGKSGAPRFDFRQWMLQNDMSFGIAISQGVEVNNTPTTAPIKDWAYRLRRGCENMLEKGMAKNAGLAIAMLLGNKEGIGEEEYAAFQRLGVAHVTAVSGLHVGILGAALMGLMNWLRVRKGWQMPVLCLFLVVYSGLAGFSAAVMRASVMLALSVLFQRWGRRGDSLATLGAAMLMVLVIDPLQALSAGFVLSFSAVAAILILTPAFMRQLGRWLPTEPFSKSKGQRRAGAILQKVKQALCVSLAAQLGVLLPTALYFHSLPLYGVLMNLLLIPFISFLVPFYGVTLLLSPIPLLGMGLGWAADQMSGWLLGVVSLLSRLPYASLRVASPTAPWLFAGALAILLLSRLVRCNWKPKLVAFGLVCLIAGVSSAALRPPDNRYVQLAVGQADAALIYSGTQTVAIDVGGDGGAIVDYLMDTGRDLDALFLTHLHLDHAGGIYQILDAGIRIHQVYLPVNAAEQRLEQDSLDILQLLMEQKIPITWLARGDELRYNEVAFRVLWPEREKLRRRQNANDLPLVMAVELGGYTILSASDLTGTYEPYAAAPCDVLKVAHHGSDESTSDPFLSFVQPSLALISCSSGSRSLPGTETLDRLENHGIPTLRTDRDGDISLWVTADGLHIQPYKQGEAE